MSGRRQLAKTIKQSSSHCLSEFIAYHSITIDTTNKVSFWMILTDNNILILSVHGHMFCPGFDRDPFQILRTKCWIGTEDLDSTKAARMNLPPPLLLCSSLVAALLGSNLIPSIVFPQPPLPSFITVIGLPSFHLPSHLGKGYCPLSILLISVLAMGYSFCALWSPFPTTTSLFDPTF